MFSIRGAITIDNDNRDEILDASRELVLKIIDSNKIELQDIISVIITCTQDIKSNYPGEAVRELGLNHAGILCVQEMYVEGSLAKCIRILMLVNGEILQNEVKHIYLRNAAVLRPDIVKEF
jgi:monofunctional chorismate mutase